MKGFAIPLSSNHLLTPDMLDTVTEVKYHVINCGDVKRTRFAELYADADKYSRIHILAFISHEHYCECRDENKPITEAAGYAFAKINLCLGTPNYHVFRYIWYPQANYSCLDNTKTDLPISIDDLKASFGEFCNNTKYGKFTYMHPDTTQDEDIIGLIMKVPNTTNDADDNMQVCEVYSDMIRRMIKTFGKNEVHDEEEGNDFSEEADFLSEAYRTNSLQELAEVLENKLKNNRSITFIFDDENLTEGNMDILGMIEYTKDRIKNIYVSPEVRHWGLAKRLVQSLGGTDRTFPTFKNSLHETVAEHVGCTPVTGIHYIKHSK